MRGDLLLSWPPLVHSTSVRVYWALSALRPHKRLRIMVESLSFGARRAQFWTSNKFLYRYVATLVANLTPKLILILIDLQMNGSEKVSFCHLFF